MLHAADASIKLGNTAPYSGPASAYGTIASAAAAYFQMLNDRGGINGHKIELISLDDTYSSPKTVEQTRRLVEQDDVLAVFSSVGTAPNIAVQKYLNLKKVPQLFVSTGASRWNDHEHFPWTVGFNPTYELEGRVYAQYILKTKPDAKIAMIIPNEDAGKDYLRGFKDGLGDHISQLVSQTTYLTTDPTIDSQIVTMQQSGADVFFAEATPKFAAMALKKAASIGWKPLIILPAVSNSVSAVLEPAGRENSIGVVTGLYLKDPNDKAWADDPALKDFLAWMKKYQPNANTGDLLRLHPRQCHQASHQPQEYHPADATARHHHPQRSRQLHSDSPTEDGKVRRQSVGAVRRRDRRIVRPSRSGVVPISRSEYPAVL